MQANAQPKQHTVNWGPVAAVGVAVGIYFSAQVFIGMVLTLLPAFLGLEPARIDIWLETSVTAQFLTVLLLEVATLAMLWLFLKSRRAKPSDIGLVRPHTRDIGYVLIGYIVYFVALLFITELADHLVPSLNVEQEQELGFDKTTTGLALLPVFVSLAVLPPFVEEILARGFLYTGLRQRLSVMPAALITGVLFAVAHLQVGSGNALLWVAALDTFILSLVLTGLREKTGSLWSPIGLHFIKNTLAFAYLFILTS